MTEAHIAFVGAFLFLSLFILISGLVGLIASRGFADGTKGPLRVVFGALTAGGLLFFGALAALIEQERRCVERVVQIQLHSHGSFRP